MMRENKEARDFSDLVKIIKLSPNNSGKRIDEISRIIPHCFVGQVSAKRGLEVFLPNSTQASANYVIGYDGTIGGGVPETHRAWTTSSRIVDNKGITIEIASDSKAPYALKDAAWNSLKELCVDICKFYGKKKLLWFSNKNTRKSYVAKSDEMVIEVHRDYANKSCPGDWLYSRLPILANEVTKLLNTNTTTTTKNEVDAAMSKNDKFIGSWTVNAKSGLHIRTGANTNKKSLGVIPYGNKVTCYGYHTDNWLLVVWNGITGFCYKTYLKK